MSSSPSGCRECRTDHERHAPRRPCGAIPATNYGESLGLLYRFTSTLLYVNGSLRQCSFDGKSGEIPTFCEMSLLSG